MRLPGQTLSFATLSRQDKLLYFGLLCEILVSRLFQLLWLFPFNDLVQALDPLVLDGARLSVEAKGTFECEKDEEMLPVALFVLYDRLCLIDTADEV